MWTFDVDYVTKNNLLLATLCVIYSCCQLRDQCQTSTIRTLLETGRGRERESEVERERESEHERESERESKILWI